MSAAAVVLQKWRRCSTGDERADTLIYSE